MNSPNSDSPLTAEQICKVVAGGTTHSNNVECLFANADFALVKWGAQSAWWGQQLHYSSPHVTRHRMERLLELFSKKIFYLHGGDEVWNCARDADGPLTKKRKAALIERELSKG